MESDRVHLHVCRSISGWNTRRQIANEPQNAARRLRILVPYTTQDLTRAALAGASELAADLCVEVVLLAVREIPYCLPLDQPDIQPAFLAEELMALTEGMSCPARIELMLARSKHDAFRQAIGPGSLVVIATKKRWWRTAEEKLACALARGGCNVSLLTLPGDKGYLITLPASPAPASTSDGVADVEVNHV